MPLDLLPDEPIAPLLDAALAAALPAAEVKSVTLRMVTDNAGPNRSNGSGLGLAVVRAVARAHGGDATATNRPTGGAIVWVRISATPAAAAIEMHRRATTL